MIETLVAELPEIYQPIYGHPDLSGRVSRSCADRLEHIVRIHDALQRLLNRPLNVLDLGCAQGYFSHNLAERGAIVHGVDFLDKNIAVCTALAQENPKLRVSFEVGRVEEIAGRLESGQYDLVLGLSIFHHIVHEKGADAVREMIEHIAEQSGALILELALREEPLYWALDQPEDPRSLLGTIPFVHEVARHGTHLAPIPRPLFIASNLYWVLGEHAARFDSWSLDPHALAADTHESSRRYFFSTDYILKLYRFDHPRSEHNKTEFTEEIRFLKKPPPGFSAPALITSGESETAAWVAMQRLSGRLLLDLLREKTIVDSRAVLLTTLEQLAILESADLYHNDVRTWNILIADNGASRLIDYGSISHLAHDCAWPENLFLAFLIFVHEVVTGVVDPPVPLRTISISPYGLPEPYRSWMIAFWKRPIHEWSFRLMYQMLLELPAETEEEATLDSTGVWMKAIEEAIQAQNFYLNHVYQQIIEKAEQAEVKAQQAEVKAQQAEVKAQQAEVKAQQAEVKAQQAEVKAQQAEVKAQQAEVKAQQAEVKAQQAEVKAQQAEAGLHAVYNSRSWRITAPLRWAGRIARWFVQGSVAWLTFAPDCRPKRVARQALISLKQYVASRPHLKARALRCLAPFPGLQNRLKRVGSIPNQSTSSFAVQGQEQLSPRARQIYHDLQAAIEQHKKGQL